MAVAHWSVLLGAGSSRSPVVVTPVCHSQDLVVPLCAVSLASIPRAGTPCSPPVKTPPGPDKAGY